MQKRIIQIVILLLLIQLLPFLPTSMANAEEVIVETKTLHVRSGPGLSYPIVGTLKKEEQVDVITRSGDWIEIQFNNQTGWIAGWLTRSSTAVKEMKKEIISQVDGLHIRYAPSTNAAVLGKMKAGEIAIQTARDGEWAAIRIHQLEGWVHTDYITETTAANSTPTSDEQLSEEMSPTHFTVAVDALHVRKKPNATSKKIGVIRKGDRYPIATTNGNWVQIELSKKEKGWVFIFHGQLSSQSSTSNKSKGNNEVITILTDGTNLREKPTTSSSIVDRAQAGEQFEVIDKQKDWYSIKLPSGAQAFVAEWVVSTNDSSHPVSTKNKEVKRVPGTLKGLTIAIDAGHGGNDRGTTGAKGTDEKDLTLLTAENLSEKLMAAGANVIMTRESDTYVSLRKRVSIAHHHEVDAFISLHYDANPDTSIHGFTTYYTYKRQAALAQAVNEGLASTLSLKNRGAQPSDFLVLRENRQNAVLIELGFLSNATEERTVSKPLFREKAAFGIYKGLIAHFDNELEQKN